jgi:hypothetical protein
VCRSVAEGCHEAITVGAESNTTEAGWEDEVGSLPDSIYTGAPTGFVGSDPVRMLRKRLESGNLRDAGTAEVDGRTVRRLVGQGFEYDVDAETFEPVRMRMFGGWVGADPESPPEKMADDLNFEVFETFAVELRNGGPVEDRRSPDDYGDPTRKGLTSSRRAKLGSGPTGAPCSGEADHAPSPETYGLPCRETLRTGPDMF